MSKDVKKAEKAVTDADIFPIESCRERIARRFGLDAVALSGPCEGAKLTDCVCEQLNSRWDRIKDRFAGNNTKIARLAVKLAASFSSKDDTGECEQDIAKLGYAKEASSGIADYIKSYAMDDAVDQEINGLLDEVDNEGDLSDGLGDGMVGDDCPGCDDDMDAGNDFDIDVVDDAEMAPDMGGMEGDMGAPDMGEEMVSIEIPREVLEDILGGDGDEMPGGEVVPGEPADMQDDGQFVEGDDIVDLNGGETETGMADGGGEMEMGGCGGCGGEMEMGGCGGCGGEMEMGGCGCGGEMEMGGQMMDKSEHTPLNPIEHKVEESEEISAIESLEQKLDELKQHEAKEVSVMEENNGESKPESDPEPEAKDESEDSEEEKREAAMQLRAGRLKRVGQNILKLGPEMSINNTDQLGGHDDKKLGNAKAKSVEDPKPLPDGNVHPEGYMAGGTKVQDGGTMGHEKKFEAHEVTKDEVTGGSSSLLGKDESFPEGKPEVPAGSSPIGGEKLKGGDLSMKGTVIATFTPKGLVIETSDGKKLLAKAKLKEVTQAMVDGVGSLKYDGDAHKFASEALKIIKQAKTTTEDGVTKTDTSKLEGSSFTNDAEKKPADGGAKTEKGAAPKEDGITETDTSKKESKNFTNDAEKKAKAASAPKKETKQASDKKVEDPKPLDKGNIKPEGYMAGGTKVQDGGTMGHEKKFEVYEVTKDEVAKGESSLMGQDEELPKDKPSVPAGGGKMGNEEWDGGNVSTKGTIIAEDTRKQVEAEAKIREARILAASAYAADLLMHGDINGDEFAETVEKIAEMPVKAIQSLAMSTRKAREKLTAHASAAVQQQTKVAGLGIPVVISSSNTESSLKERLVKQFKLTKQLNALDSLRENRE